MEYRHALRVFARLLIVLLVFGDLALAAVWGWRHLPPNWRPWHTVELDQPPTPLAHLQINLLRLNGNACMAALGRSRLSFLRIPDRPLVNGCGIANGVHILRSHQGYSSRFSVTCPMAAALYWWEQALDAAAQAEFGARLARIDHVGSYTCRNIGSGDGRRSQHATANAIDIEGFRLSNGKVIRIARHWNAATSEGRFLQRAREDACRFFNVVLGPEYNLQHAAHFHLDMSPFLMCR
ncbi:MAG: extensin-like domain-containing protein [Alphaproteobacteria bacterium]